jgi:hypothetical protein
VDRVAAPGAGSQEGETDRAENPGKRVSQLGIPGGLGDTVKGQSAGVRTVLREPWPLF